MKRKLIKRNKNRFSYEFKNMQCDKRDGSRLVYVNMSPAFGIEYRHIAPRYVFPTKSKGIIHDWESIKWWFDI